MYSASIFSKEEKLPVTKLSDILAESNSTCFTVEFTAKVDDKAVRDRLATITAAELKNPKALAKELLEGRRTTLVGHLTKSESRLGRSLMIDLASRGYRSIDHRTLKSLIFKNVKYVLN